MKTHFKLFFFIAIAFFSKVNAQTDTVINGKHYQSVDEKKAATPNQPLKVKKHQPPVDSSFVIDNKKLKYYNSWLTLGGGIQQNLTYKRKYGFAGGLDFNFHIRHQYFQLGTVITGEKFGSYDNYNFHLGYGKRFEDKDFHVSAFLGISYSTGFAMVDSTHRYERPFREPGIYAEGQVVKKIAYDVGIGISIFGDYNQEQAIAGGRIIIYFSGAYDGKYNKQYRGK